MNEYPLTDIETVAGTMRVTLFSDQAGLTVPSVNTIIEVGDLEETSDIDIGVTQLSTLSLTIQDNYATYTQGFWYKVLATECWLRFYLDEGSGNTFYFFGIPQSETIVWTEHFNDESSYVRTAEMELLSMISVLTDTPTVDWRDEVLANAVDTGALVVNDPSHKISVMGLFSAMLSAAGLNSTYAESDTTFIYGTEDFKFKEGVNTYRVDEISIAAKIYIGSSTYEPTEYFLSSSGFQLSERFATLKELIPNLLANFGLVLRYSYDVGAQRHNLEIIQRGRAYPDGERLTFGNQPKAGTIQKSTDLLGDATKAEFLLPADGTVGEDDLGYGTFVWFSKKFLDGFDEGYTQDDTTEIPDYVEFDREFQVLFLLNVLIVQSGIGHSRQLYVVSGSTWTILTGIDYFNYTSDSYVTASATGARLMEEALAGYIYYRFTNEYTSIIRTYSGIKANNGTTDSHVNASILQRASINDGISAQNYYANKVTKSIANDELTIEWILE